MKQGCSSCSANVANFVLQFEQVTSTACRSWVWTALDLPPATFFRLIWVGEGAKNNCCWQVSMISSFDVSICLFPLAYTSFLIGDGIVMSVDTCDLSILLVSLGLINPLPIFMSIALQMDIFAYLDLEVDLAWWIPTLSIFWWAVLNSSSSAKFVLFNDSFILEREVIFCFAWFVYLTCLCFNYSFSLSISSLFLSKSLYDHLYACFSSSFSFSRSRILLFKTEILFWHFSCSTNVLKAMSSFLFSSRSLSLCCCCCFSSLASSSDFSFSSVSSSDRYFLHSYLALSTSFAFSV